MFEGLETNQVSALPVKEIRKQAKKETSDQPEKKLQRSTAWTADEQQILYDLIATGESNNATVIQELLPGKSISSIRNKIAGLKKMYACELKVQKEMAEIMSFRTASLERRRGKADQMCPENYKLLEVAMK